MEKFRTQKAEEKITALRLVDAFVTTYSGLRAEFGPSAPVPATFRAHSIESFNKNAGNSDELLLRWVGRAGREITTPPADRDMAETIEAFATQRDPAPVSAFSEIDGRMAFRTVYPSLAREQSCVHCHNKLQPDKPAWQLNDVMGAFVIDVPVGKFLREIHRQGYEVGIGLFLALTGLGLAISVLHFRQVSEREAAASELRVQNVRFDAALKNMSQGLCMFDGDMNLVIANERYGEMYGLDSELLKRGTPFRKILEARVAAGAYAGSDPEQYINERLAAVRERHTSTKIHTLPDRRVIAISHQPMADGGWVATHDDITEQRRYEAKIAHMALHDGLTDLPNRTLLNERLEHALSRVKRGDIVATHLLDLDLFKNVNDTLGHTAGDELLKAVADRLRALVRETDTVARMGGDEFAILQVAVQQPSDVATLAQRIILAISEPYDINGNQVVLGTSIGIAVGPGDGTDPDQLLKNADLALYRAKGEGRGKFHFFEPGMDVQMQARRALERDMRSGLPAGEFEFHYQPVVNIERNEITGFEALIRWRHPQKGTIRPAEFIPLAEETGFIVQLGEWAIREACTTAATWPPHLSVAVNLSPVQFRNGGLVQAVVNALADSGLAGHRLELEITESVLLEGTEATLAMLRQLRELGVRIVMDDFGTGYSSLGYLQRFPFDKIKIDRSFVMDITEASGSRNIVRAVAAMARGLGIETTAEGVETQAQLATVASEGCTEMQGILVSRPVPASEVPQLLLSSYKLKLSGAEATTEDAA